MIKNVQHFSKLFKIVWNGLNGFKLFQMIQNGPKWYQVDKKLSQIVSNGLKWFHRGMLCTLVIIKMVRTETQRDRGSLMNRLTHPGSQWRGWRGELFLQCQPSTMVLVSGSRQLERRRGDISLSWGSQGRGGSQASLWHKSVLRKPRKRRQPS